MIDLILSSGETKFVGKRNFEVGPNVIQLLNGEDGFDLGVKMILEGCIS